MQISRRSFLGAAASLAAVHAARGQEQTSAPPNFSTDVKVVNVFATVRNGKGEIVRNLTVNDFTLAEDNRPQVLRYFYAESDLPLTLGLLIDTSGSQRRVLPDERTASSKFFDQVVREDKDQAFLIHFDRDVELLEDLTNSRQTLKAALDKMDSPALRRADDNSSQPSSYPGGGQGGQGGGYPRSRGRSGGGGTTLYDAIYLAGNDVLRKQTGRKAVVVLSDGVDNGSKTSLNGAIEAAQRSDTIVYSILFADEQENTGGGFGGFGGGFPGGGFPGGGRRGGGRGRAPAQRVDGKKILEQISKETGGSLFEVSKKHPLEEIYSKIQEELRNQYNLGYSSDQRSGGGYRKIQVTVKTKGLTVQARDGYYAS